MRKLIPILILVSALPVNAKPKILVNDPTLQNIGIGRELERTLSFLPGVQTAQWTILVETHGRFQKEAGNIHHRFPQRCVTYTDRHETHCDAAWVMEFSGLAKAGTLAHEYGHIACGCSDEREADKRGWMAFQQSINPPERP